VLLHTLLELGFN